MFDERELQSVARLIDHEIVIYHDTLKDGTRPVRMMRAHCLIAVVLACAGPSIGAYAPTYPSRLGAIVVPYIEISKVVREASLHAD